MQRATGKVEKKKKKKRGKDLHTANLRYTAGVGMRLNRVGSGHGDSTSAFLLIAVPGQPEIAILSPRLPPAIQQPQCTKFTVTHSGNKKTTETSTQFLQKTALTLHSRPVPLNPLLTTEGGKELVTA